MDDLTICKKIAEIEGILNPSCDGADIYANVGDDDLPIWEQYNPLTDDALTWRLMIKYQIRLCWEYDGTWICFKNGISKALSKDKASNKSVCMAVIELHEIQQGLGVNNESNR